MSALCFRVICDLPISFLSLLQYLLITSRSYYDLPSFGNRGLLETRTHGHQVIAK